MGGGDEQAVAAALADFDQAVLRELLESGADRGPADLEHVAEAAFAREEFLPHIFPDGLANGRRRLAGKREASGDFEDSGLAAHMGLPVERCGFPPGWELDSEG